MTANPRVLVVVEQLRRAVPGGIGRSAVALLGGLKEVGGAEATLWASRPPGGSDPLDALGWPLRTHPLPGRLLTRAWGRGLCPAPRGFDVVHATSLAVPPAGRGQGRRGRVPVSATVHDLAWRLPEASTPRGRRWHEAALGRALRHCTHLMVPSSPVAAELVAAGAAPSRVTVVPWGADHLAEPDGVAAAELLDAVGIAGPFLLAVGTLEPRKNLARLLEAYRRARPSLPEPWPLVVLGPPGWGAVAAALQVGPEPGVHLIGQVRDPVLTALYDRARLLAYVPLAEGFGFPPVEALTRGLPCVASTAVPSVAAADGPPPAVMVDPLDVDAVAAGLMVAATDEDRRGQLVAAGHAHVAGLTWGAAASAYRDLWRELR